MRFTETCKLRVAFGLCFDKMLNDIKKRISFILRSLTFFLYEVLIYKTIQGLLCLPECMHFSLEDGQDFPRHVRKIVNTFLSSFYIVSGT